MQRKKVITTLLGILATTCSIDVSVAGVSSDMAKTIQYMMNISSDIQSDNLSQTLIYIAGKLNVKVADMCQYLIDITANQSVSPSWTQALNYFNLAANSTGNGDIAVNWYYGLKELYGVYEYYASNSSTSTSVSKVTQSTHDAVSHNTLTVTNSVQARTDNLSSSSTTQSTAAVGTAAGDDSNGAYGVWIEPIYSMFKQNTQKYKINAAGGAVGIDIPLMEGYCGVIFSKTNSKLKFTKSNSKVSSDTMVGGAYMTYPIIDNSTHIKASVLYGQSKVSLHQKLPLTTYNGNYNAKVVISLFGIRHDIETDRGLIISPVFHVRDFHVNEPAFNLSNGISTNKIAKHKSNQQIYTVLMKMKMPVPMDDSMTVTPMLYLGVDMVKSSIGNITQNIQGWGTSIISMPGTKSTRFAVGGEVAIKVPNINFELVPSIKASIASSDTTISYILHLVVKL